MQGLLYVFILYISIILFVGLCSYFYTKSFNHYILGNRSLSSPIIALGAGSSDMSSWLLLALPGTVMFNGLNQIWLPLGLLIGAYLNWSIIAKRLRIYTELANNSITIPSYLENRFQDKYGYLRFISASIILIFFCFYTASGLVSGGLLFSSVFNISYSNGLYITAFLIFFYTFLGGFVAISWIDFVQGILMFAALIIVPIVLFIKIKLYSPILHFIDQNNLYHYFNLFDHTNLVTILSLLSWGLGYFGQPHILIRFMAIKEYQLIIKAKYICMIWMSISIIGAIFTGILGMIYYFPIMLKNPETLFLIISKTLFEPYISGILLAAVLSAILSTASAQLLTSSTTLVEDFYHMFRTNANYKEMLLISRIFVFIITLISVILALNPNHSILNLVSYAWSGLGGTLGPVILLSIFWRRMNSYGAGLGMIVGMITIIVLHYFNNLYYELLPAFILNVIFIIIGSLLTKFPNKCIIEKFDKLKNYY